MILAYIITTVIMIPICMSLWGMWFEAEGGTRHQGRLLGMGVGFIVPTMWLVLDLIFRG